MNQAQLRHFYQMLNSAYDKLAQVREESVPGLKDAKDQVFHCLVEVNNQLNGDWRDNER